MPRSFWNSRTWVETYLDHLLLCEIALFSLLDSMRKLSKCWSWAGDTAHLRSSTQVGSLLRLLLQMSGLRSSRLLKSHLTLELGMLLLHLLWLLRL